MVVPFCDGDLRRGVDLYLERLPAGVNQLRVSVTS
jgi:hypothetical protein